MKELPVPKTPEFSIVTQTSSELVVKQRLQSKAPIITAIILGMFLLGIVLTFLVPFVNSGGWSWNSVLSTAYIMLPWFWGFDLLLMFIMSLIPERESWRINTLQGTMQEHIIYPFRMKVKDPEISLAEVAWLLERPAPFDSYHKYEKLLVVKDGREIMMQRSTQLKEIEDFFKIIEQYLPASVKRVVSVFTPEA